MAESLKPLLHFTDSGPNTGRVLLMLHGNLSSCRWWERLVPLLPEGWRVLCPDFRGYGRSAAAPPDYTAATMAQDVNALLDALDIEELIIVGHSMGGAVALLLTLELRERVLALALLDPVPAGGLQLPEGTLTMMGQMRTDRHVLRASLSAIASAAPRDAYFESLVDDAAQCGPPAWRDVPLSFAHFDITARLGEIACPVLCIMGSNDVVIPAKDVAAMCRELRHCEHATLAGIGHCPQIEDADACAALLRPMLERVAERSIANG